MYMEEDDEIIKINIESPAHIDKSIPISDIKQLEDHMSSFYMKPDPETSEHIENNGSIHDINFSIDEELEEGSDSGSDDYKRRVNYKKLTYYDVQQIIDRYYDIDNNKYSNVLDILITYLRGQKTLYIQSRHITQFKLNILIIPSIIVNAAITIFAPLVQGYSWGGIIISILNAIIAIFISLSRYLKLETMSEMYLIIANQYEKLETNIITINNKIIFNDHSNEPDELVFGKIKEFERRMNEIKESCPFLIPEETKYLFPIISHINVFSLIKKLENYKKQLIVRLKDVKNEIRYIYYKEGILDMSFNIERNKTSAYQRIKYLFEVKEKLKEELTQYKTVYVTIDEMFSREITMAENERKARKKCMGYLMLFFSSKTSPQQYNTGNSIIDKHLNFILSK